MLPWKNCILKVMVIFLVWQQMKAITPQYSSLSYNHLKKTADRQSIAKMEVLNPQILEIKNARKNMH